MMLKPIGLPLVAFSLLSPHTAWSADPPATGSTGSATGTATAAPRRAPSPSRKAAARPARSARGRATARPPGAQAPKAPSAPAGATGANTAPVTQTRTVDVDLNQPTTRPQNQPAAAPPQAGAPTATPAGASSTASGGASHGHALSGGHSSMARAAQEAGFGEKALTVYFDFVAYTRPGVADFTFSNFHSYVFMDVLSPKFQFSFDLSSQRGSPSFYELDYLADERWTIRVGKIWIPFDDLSPHNLFGGRVGVSSLTPPGVTEFLPTLWTDLGVAAKYVAVDTPSLLLDTHLYAVNGFGAGTGDPVTAGGEYPNFSDRTFTDARDNNGDKAIGARAHAWINGKLGVGVSGYTEQWNNRGEGQKLRLTAIGADAQLRLARAELRTGMIQMKFKVPNDSVRRGGFYGEIGVPFSDQRWKFLARGGALNYDDRIIDNSDQTIVGAMLLYSPLPWQFSIEHSRDVQRRAGKVGTEYTAARFVIRL